MHELPPLIHRSRDRMIDVHHTILPPTGAAEARSRRADRGPGAGAVGERDHGEGLSALSPGRPRGPCGDASVRGRGPGRGLAQPVGHSLPAREGAEGLEARAALHGVAAEVARAVRLSTALFEGGAVAAGDRPYARRLLARDGWGRSLRSATRFGFYVRSHWLRMPPLMLARHLW
jgi:hypothetical protein